mmetsp:Transcript_17373/g.50528  ORF Transcript_17373/g.50528 Transcript_17373/m.50528 type:complete len:94 (-) Transcript_17373:113-394(-)
MAKGGACRTPARRESFLRSSKTSQRQTSNKSTNAALNINLGRIFCHHRHLFRLRPKDRPSDDFFDDSPIFNFALQVFRSLGEQATQELLGAKS